MTLRSTRGLGVWVLGVALAVGLLLSCGDDNSPTSTLPPEKDEVQQTTLAPDSTTIVAFEQGLEAEFPAGAVSQAIDITITKRSPQASPDEYLQTLCIGPLYDLEPSGLTFSAPVEVHVSIAGLSLPDWLLPTDLELATAEGDSIVHLPTEVENGYLVSSIWHFSPLRVAPRHMEEAWSATPDLFVWFDGDWLRFGGPSAVVGRNGWLLLFEELLGDPFSFWVRYKIELRQDRPFQTDVSVYTREVERLFWGDSWRDGPEYHWIPGGSDQDLQAGNWEQQDGSTTQMGEAYGREVVYRTTSLNPPRWSFEESEILPLISADENYLREPFFTDLVSKFAPRSMLDPYASDDRFFVKIDVWYSDGFIHISDPDPLHQGTFESNRFTKGSIPTEDYPSPTVRILSPPAGGRYSAGTAVRFHAEITATGGATCSPDDVIWTSSRAGRFGTGTDLTYSGLGTGTQEIACQVTDSRGKSGRASVTIEITGAPPNEDPTLTLQAPSGTSSGNIRINYTLTDREGDASDWVVRYDDTGTGDWRFATVTATSAGGLVPYGSGGTKIAGVPPGSRNFVWDSAADLPSHQGSVRLRMHYLRPNNVEAWYRQISFGVENLCPDTEAPEVDITAPVPLSTVSGVVPIRATATDNVAVTRVEFEVKEGQSYRSIGSDVTAPYEIQWDTREFSNGDHNVHARAYDDCGNSATAGIRVTVDNPDGENTPPTGCFVVTPESGTTETEFLFDASCCTDMEDPVSALEVRWDWENDGTWDHPALGYTTVKTATHQFGSTGTKTTKLEVKDTGGLTGTTTRTVTVSSEGTPTLVVKPTALDFGTSQRQKPFTITNGGGGTLTWSVTDDRAWLSASPTSGNTTTEEDEVTVTVDRSGLSAGSYSGTVTVTPGSGPAQPVAVTMEVSGGGPIPGSMVLVTAGAFTMGDGVAYCGEDECQVTLTHGFYLGQYEVTNQEYRDAVQWAYDQGYVTASSSTVNDNLDGSTALLVDLGSSYCQISFSGGTFVVDAGKENHPMVEVSWYGAAAYCDWFNLQAGLPRAYNHSTWQCHGGNPYGAAGYRLPTDAEWEYAAQYDDERIYPWGDEAPDCSRTNYYYDCVGSTSAVGSYPAAPAALDLYDMAGNVWEWCNDWHQCSLGTSPASDPPGPASGSSRVLRGGSWDYYVDGFLRCADRYSHGAPSYASNRVGFRCARSQ